MDIQISDIFYGEDGITVRFRINDHRLHDKDNYLDLRVTPTKDMDVEIQNEVSLLAVKQLADLFLEFHNDLIQIHESKNVTIPWTSQ